MNKIKFYALSVAQNFALAIAFMIAGVSAAKYGFCQDVMDYREYRSQQAKKVFRRG